VLIIRRSKLHYTASGIITHTYRWPSRAQVERKNKLIVKQKFCASSWLITEMKLFVSLHGCLIILQLRQLKKVSPFYRNIEKHVRLKY